MSVILARCLPTVTRVGRGPDHARSCLVAGGTDISTENVWHHTIWLRMVAELGTKVIVATDREAPYVLDEILGNQTDLPITEHATDTHGASLINLPCSPWSDCNSRPVSGT